VPTALGKGYEIEVFNNTAPNQTRILRTDAEVQFKTVYGHEDAFGILLAPLPTGSINTAMLGDANAAQGRGVSTAKLLDLSVTQAKLALLSVGTAQLIDANVTLAKLAANSVDATKIVDGSVGSGELATDAVTNVKVAADAINTAEIVNLAVTQGKLALLSVGTGQLIDNAVTTAKIADNNVTDAKIVGMAASKLTGTITSAQIADGAIVNADINASAAIDGSKLANASVTASKVAADVATQAELDAHAGDSSDPHGSTLTQTTLSVSSLTGAAFYSGGPTSVSNNAFSTFTHGLGVKPRFVNGYYSAGGSDPIQCRPGWDGSEINHVFITEVTTTGIVVLNKIGGPVDVEMFAIK
jgi:hypothetical protein